MDSKKLTQIATILILGISIALTGTVVATKIAKQKATTQPYSEATQAQSITETTTTTTTVPKETVPMGGNSVITTAPTQKPQWKIDEEASISASISQAKAKSTTKKTAQKTTTKAYNGIVPQTRAAVIESYLKGVNNLKKTKNFTLTRRSSSNYEITDITGGYIVQQALQTLIKYEDISSTETFSFKNGIDSSNNFTPEDALPPYGGTAKLNDSAVYSATAKSLSDGGYTLTIKLKDEYHSMNQEPKNIKNITETIDIEEKFSTVELENYELTYDGITITALFDKNNRITYIEHFIPVTGATANGVISYVPFTVSFNSEDVIQYDISY